VGSAGGPAWPRTERLIGYARELADRSGSPQSRFFALGPAGGALFCAGRFREGADRIAEALALLDDGSLGLVHERVTMSVFLIDAFKFLGRYRELRRLQHEALRDARARGDLYAAVELTVGNASFAWLAEDRPDLADGNAADVMREWSTKGFHLEHMHDIEGRTRTRLYAGDAETAHALARELAHRVKRSLLRRVQVIRWSVFYLRAGSALAMIERGLGDRVALLVEAEAGARAIARERMGWMDPFAGIIRAGIALHTGAREAAIRGLEASARDLSAADLSGYALAARDRAARLRGAAGDADVASIAEAFRAEDVLAPERMARMLVPGMLA
jgi:hypothetical protein